MTMCPSPVSGQVPKRVVKVGHAPGERQGRGTKPGDAESGHCYGENK